MAVLAVVTRAFDELKEKRSVPRLHGWGLYVFEIPAARRAKVSDTYKVYVDAGV